MTEERSDGRHVDPFVHEPSRDRVPQTPRCETCRGLHMLVVELGRERARIEHPAGCPCQCTIEGHAVDLPALVRHAQSRYRTELPAKWFQLPFLGEAKEF